MSLNYSSSFELKHKEKFPGIKVLKELTRQE